MIEQVAGMIPDLSYTLLSSGFFTKPLLPLIITLSYSPCIIPVLALID
jgi:hypothetical protein